MGLLKQKISFLFLIILLLNCLSTAQQQDTTQEIPTQYRRGVELQNGYQSYTQKYFDKDLNEEKRKLFPLMSTGVWTEINPKVPRVDYLGIHFINIDTGWAVGDLGAIIKTTNGGTDWETIESNTTNLILKVQSFDGQTVIASGFDGLILRSTDAGETFTQITSGVIGDLWGLQMINDTLGWACGTINSLIKTTDGGITWQTVTTPGYTGNKWWLDFLTENYGFIAGDGKVLRTTNGGNSWEIIQAGDNQALYSIDVIDSLHIAAAGYGGTGYRGKTIYSSDGGDNWITGGQTTFDPINCIKYVSADTGYFVMGDVGMWKTTDHGQNWTGIVGLNNIGEYEIQLFPELSKGYSAGISLKLFRAVNNLDTWHKMIINDDLVDIFFTSEQKGYALSQGIYGKLYRTTNYGVHWDTVQGVPGGNCITFIDSLTGFYGTAASQIYKTTDGGENWYATNGIITRIAKILFVSHQTGWAVGETRIYKTTDSGENWFEQVNRPGAGFTSISFLDSLYGWASLGGWNPYETTDGGINWIEQTNFNNYNTSDVYFTNQDTGWITGDYTGFILYKTIDAGVTWDTVAEVLGPYKFNYFPNRSHWIINGFRVYLTTDSGNAWNDITNDIPAGFNNFQAPTDFVGYAAGPGGLILKYNDTTFTPVELITFTTSLINDNVVITWSTATETNNKGFEVERLQDYKISRLQNWEKLGFVPGNGTTTLPNQYSFEDNSVEQGKYFYRLKQIDFNGGYNYSKEIEVDVNVPRKFSLEQNYPNPFNPATTIKYGIPKTAKVELKIYDFLGREIKTLVNNETKNPGYYEVQFNAGNLASGVYFYRLKTNEYIKTGKMLLIK